MKHSKSKTRQRIYDIVDELGGPSFLAKSLRKSNGKNPTPQAVSGWYSEKNETPQIPQQYFPQIIKLSGGAVTLSRLSGVIE